ncbi:MAG TPA: peptidoglycan-binding domain-containing protein [Candidatus Sulfotelmatobacter sp.]|nr:peptidoglycan-binding domain-containing protein [Candidatus Sulfotelmatobacter sp.]
MTKPRHLSIFPDPPLPWTKTDIPPGKDGVPGGIQKIYRIWEDLRARNGDGYVPSANGGGILANVIDHGGLAVNQGTTCSPFTATVIALAFDPEYPRQDMPVKGGDPYVPMFNNGKDKLPFHDFYQQHNGDNQPIESIVKYMLGVEKDPTEMRRGDLLGVDWLDVNKSGHAIFCWDVHLDANGKVDAFQYLGANSVPWWAGVTIGHCAYKPWIKGNPKMDRKAGDPGIENARAPDPVFKDEPLVVQRGQWLVLPGVKEGSIDPKTFLVEPDKGKIAYPKDGTFTVRKVRVGRLNYTDPVPEPYCMKKGGAAAMAAPVAAHAPARPVVIAGADLKKNPEKPKAAPAQPAKQNPDTPAAWQLIVESALQTFFRTEWIKSDPGDPDMINDPKSKAAIKEYQTLLKLKVDGIVGKQTLGSVLKQLPYCVTQLSAQLMLADLYRGKKISTDPGPANGVHHAQTRSAVEEFQKANGLPVTGVPDADTYEKLKAVRDGHAATSEKPGLAPEMKHLYWFGNSVAPGGTAVLCLHSEDLQIGQECPIVLKDDASGKQVTSTAKFNVNAKKIEVPVPIPADFGAGASVRATVTAAIGDGGTLETTTKAPLQVQKPSTAPVLERADWRPYVGKDSLPDEIVEIVKRNRAKYPTKTLPPAQGGPNNSYEGPDKYDYKPPASHQKWATAYFQKKQSDVTGHEKSGLTAYLNMLVHEGYPASLQTYDGLIVTWGVGLGGTGNGVHTFENLNKDPAMKQRLDDIGINFFDVDYHVVDVAKKKVVTSSVGKSKGEDWRHIVPLKSCREQPDLLCALIGISEDPATREAVAEAMYTVYKTSTALWPNQDKVFTEALYFMVTHLRAWVPAAGNPIDVGKIFATYASGTPSVETDKKIAQPILRQFIRGLKKIYLDTRKQPGNWQEMRGRAKSHVWRDLRKEGKKEGFDPGDFEYEEGY